MAHDRAVPGREPGASNRFENDGTGNIVDGINPETALTSGSDTVAENTSTAHSLTVGSSVTGYINTSSDEDWFSIELVAGQTYEFALNGTTTGGGPALGDPLVKLYNANGVQVELDDDGGPGLNSLLTFTADSSGTYYIEADAFEFATGEYTLSAALGTPPSPAGDPLTAIDWGTTVTPTAGVINVYFAANGETFDGVTSQGWTAYEIQRAMAAFGVFEDVIDVTFNQVGSAASADFKLVTTTGLGALGYFNPPGTTNAGVGVFDTGEQGWNTTGGLEQGGYAFITLIHEFGHGMGLAHPHDTGGGSNVLSGVSTNFGDVGDFSLNQGVYTTMSYNDGWLTNPAGQSTSNNYGWQGTMMALDIASLQADYGVNTTFNTGADSYILPTTNAAGTFYASIWDAGGTDTIQHTGSANATIDLRAANLQYAVGGGGYVSYVDGIQGGFTIANGVTIENAIGGSGDDTITGNDSNNILEGGAGADTIDGGSGNSDTASYETSDAGVTVSLGGAGSATGGHAAGDTLISIEYLIGSNFDDVLTGNGLSNGLFGRGGNDTLNGSSADDFLFGEAGDDLLIGGAGGDQLVGGTHNAIGDTVSYSNSNAAVTVNIGTGVHSGGHAVGDTLTGIENLFGSSQGDTLTGDGGDNELNGWLGNDILNGGGGADFLSGSVGNDTIDYSDSALGVAVHIANGVTTTTGGDATGDTFYNVENLTGSAQDDTLRGTTLSNVINGGDGVDTILASNGNDTINGGDGDDILNGGRGADTIDGGNGSDTATYTNSDLRVIVDLEAGTMSGSGHAGGDTLISIENLTGSAFNDILTGDGGVNVLNGFIGNDQLNGGGGADTLTGHAGNDTLNGGAGNDTMHGGAGNDTFEFDTLTFGQDTIIGWQNGQDLVDFSFLGLTHSDFTETQVGANTVLALNTDPSQTLTFAGISATTIDANDFV